MISAVRHVAMASDFDSKMVHFVLTLLSSVQPRLNLGGHAGL